MTHTRTGAPFAVLLALTPVWVSPALAQDAPGLSGTFSFSQTLNATDNPGFVADPADGSVEARTRLGFTLDSATRTETFRLSLGTVYEGGLDGNGDDFEFVRDSASVNYTREGAASRLSLGASYDESELDDIEIELDFDPDLLTLDGGSVQRIGANARLETGIGAPFGVTLSGRYNETNYLNTIDPDLENSESLGLDATASFRINPTLTARALAGISRTREDDVTATKRDRRYIGFGFSGDLARGLSFSGNVTYDEVETSTNAPSSTIDDGVGLTLSVTQARPNGTLGATFSSRIDEGGRLTQARINRSLDLPDGSLSFSLGIIDPETSGTRPVASLDYSRETARGALSARVSQSPTTDDGETVLNTAIRLNYSQAINDISGWSAGLSYSEANTLGSDDDISRTSASVSYRRDLAQDWDLRAGYSYSVREETAEPDRTENSLFLSLERDFSFGF